MHMTRRTLQANKKTDWRSLFLRYCAIPAWATIETTAIRIVYLGEKLFTLKCNLDELSFRELKQITYEIYRL